MILSFDLDGVIADTDNAILSLLHACVYRGYTSLSDEEYLLQYYARRQVKLNPQEFLGPDDEYVVITGRVPFAHDITQTWVAHHLPACKRVFLVGDKKTEEAYHCRRDGEATAIVAERKCQVIKDAGVDVHFDNNPKIVKHLRANGVVTIQVGGGLA